MFSFDHSLQLYVAVLSRVTRDEQRAFLSEGIITNIGYIYPSSSHARDVQRAFLSEGERMDTAARDHVHTNTLCWTSGEGVGGRGRGQSSADRAG